MVESKIHWSKREVLSFLENLISLDLHTEEEMELYEDYIWYGTMNRSSDTYRRVIRKMKREWDGE